MLTFAYGRLWHGPKFRGNAAFCLLLGERGFHRIRHYGMLANGQRTDSVAKARELLAVPAPVAEPEPGQHESDKAGSPTRVSLLR